MSSANHGSAFPEGGCEPYQATGQALTGQEATPVPLSQMESAWQAARGGDEGTEGCRSAVQPVQLSGAPVANGSEIGGEGVPPNYGTTALEPGRGVAQMQSEGRIGSEVAGTCAQEGDLALRGDTARGRPCTDTTAMAQQGSNESHVPARKHAIPRLPIAGRASQPARSTPPVVPRLPVAASQRNRPDVRLSSGVAVAAAPRDDPDDDVVFVGQVIQGNPSPSGGLLWGPSMTTSMTDVPGAATPRQCNTSGIFCTSGGTWGQCTQLKPSFA